MPVLSLRTRIAASAGAALLLVGGVGALAHTQNTRLGALAVGIYDNAVRGISFATEAQVTLLRFRIAHAGTPLDDAARGELQAIADRLDVARQLAITPRTRDAVIAAHAAVAAVQSAGAPALAGADEAARKLVNRFSADALDVRDNAVALAASSRRALGGVILGAAGLAAALGWLLIRAVVPPIRRALLVATAIAEGRLDNAIPTTGRDEAGQLLATLARMQAAIAGNLAQIQASREAERIEAEQAATRAATLASTTARFEHEVGQTLHALGDAAAGLRTASGEMTGAAEDASTRATTVADAAGQTATVVQTVAAATEQLAASIREVGGSVDRATRIIGSAVNQAQETDRTVHGLTGAADKIGAIVDVIRSIAAQTNLLALNATIEAARAGDAGRGFAVVANEVKALANQTARATDEIAAQIGTMQVETGHAAAAIRGIATTINDVNALSLSIASAMEQQGHATAEIARSIVTAAAGTGEVSGNIDSVTRSAGHVHATAGQVLQAATALSGQSDRLRAEVGRFLDDVRAA